MTQEFSAGPFRNRPMLFNEARRIGGHTHNFGHITWVLRGTIRFWHRKDGVVVRERTISNTDAKPYFYIPPDVEHWMEALTADALGYCSFASRIPVAFAERVGLNAEYDAKFAELSKLAEELFGDIVQEDNGWTPAST